MKRLGERKRERARLGPRGWLGFPTFLRVEMKKD